MTTEVVVTVVIAVIGICLQFYFKLVTDPNDMRRHLKTAAWWAWDLWAVGWPGHQLWELSHQSLTSAHVGMMCIDASAIALAIGFSVVRRLLLLMATQQAQSERTTKQFGRALDILTRHRNAWVELINDPSVPPDLVERVTMALNKGLPEQ